MDGRKRRPPRATHASGPRQEAGDRPERCPACGSSQIVTIVWGLPDLDAVRERGAEDVAYGGCVVPADPPRWRCRGCGADIFPDGRTGGGGRIVLLPL